MNPYRYIGTTERLFEYESGTKKSLDPGKTYLLDDSDHHVVSWIARSLLVPGDLADVEDENGSDSGENGGESGSGGDTENGGTTGDQTGGGSGENSGDPDEGGGVNDGESGSGGDQTEGDNGGRSYGEIPDHVDEGEPDFFYFGWSESPWQIERQDRNSGASEYIQGVENFEEAWANRKTLSF